MNGGGTWTGWWRPRVRFGARRHTHRATHRAHRKQLRGLPPPPPPASVVPVLRPAFVPTWTPGHVALCFLLTDTHAHVDRWKDWLTHPRVHVTVHAKNALHVGAAWTAAAARAPDDTRLASAVAALRAGLMPASATVQTTRGSLSIVHATAALFAAAAAAAPQATLFFLVSGSCVPVKRPEYVLAHVAAMQAANPRVCIVNFTTAPLAACTKPAEAPLRWRGLMSRHRVPASACVAHSQWIAVSRAAIPLLQARDWDGEVSDMSVHYATDEFLPGTRLLASGWNTRDGSLITGSPRAPHSWATFVRWPFIEPTAPFASAAYIPQRCQHGDTSNSPRVFLGTEADFDRQWRRVCASKPFPYFLRKVDANTRLPPIPDDV